MSNKEPQTTLTVSGLFSRFAEKAPSLDNFRAGIPAYQMVIAGLAISFFIFFFFFTLLFRTEYHPLAAPPESAFEKVIHPRVVNGFKILPVIDFDIIEIAVAEDSDEIWIAGAGGELAKSGDNGYTWTMISCPVKEVFDVSFVRTKGGQGSFDIWVVGMDGQFFFTKNEGERWYRKLNTSISSSRSRAISPRSTAIHFINPMAGWIASPGGQLFATVNGGENWELQNNFLPDQAPGQAAHTPPGDVVIHSVFFVNESQGWAVGAQGAILSTVNGGREWVYHGFPEAHDLNSVFFANEYQGWAVGDYGTILMTVDGGIEWRESPDSSRYMVSFHKVVFKNSDQGWIVGDDGFILFSENEGLGWRRQNTASTGNIYAIAALSRGVLERRVYRLLAGGGSGAAEGSGKPGLLLYTNDGGGAWQSNARPALQSLTVSSMDKSQLLIWSDDKPILHSKDFGKTWRSGRMVGQIEPAPLDTGPLSMRKDRYYIEDGVLYHSQAQEQGKQVESKDLPDDYFTGLSFFKGGASGFLLGRKGLYKTLNSGRNWRSVFTSASGPLLALYFNPDGIHGVVMGRNDVFFTSDSGKTWAAVEPVVYTSWPRYLLVLGFTLGLIFLVAVKMRRSKNPPKPEISDILISDKPLEFGNPDPLGYSSVSQGLSRFIRNHNTEPPLTLAISGKWGSGKSSIMNMLKGDLDQAGAKTVWFNAWHHQKETSLLAALLDSIIQQSVPKLLSTHFLNGLLYRVRMLFIRLWRKKFTVILSLFLLCTGYLVLLNSRKPEGASVSWWDFFKDPELNKLIGGSEPVMAILAYLFLAGGGGASLRIIQGLASFTTSTVYSAMTNASTAKASDFKAMICFRSVFAMEFNDVCRASHPFPVVIFIDDLDRCKAENVVEILETVNFLISAGDCFVVIGADMEYVEKCVKGKYESADEDFDAKLYLEKLINLRVDVPEFRKEHAKSLIKSQLSTEVLIQKRIHNFLQISATWLERGFWTAAFLLCAYFLANQANANLEGMAQANKSTAPANAPRQSAAEDSAKANKEMQASSSGNIMDVPDMRRGNADPWATSIVPGYETSLNKERLINGHPVFSSSIIRKAVIFLVVIAIIIAAILVISWLESRSQLHDSEDFKDALLIWSAMIYARKGTTPRSIKRFMNRLRYLAMRQKRDYKEAPMEALARKIAIRLYPEEMKKQEEEEKAGRQDRLRTLKEHTLVALSAVHHFDKTLLGHDKILEFLRNGKNGLEGASESLSDEVVEEFIKAAESHKEKFESYPVRRQEDPERFLDLHRTVHA